MSEEFLKFWSENARLTRNSGTLTPVKLGSVMLAVMLSTLPGARLGAHHRYADVYKEDAQISLEGDVVEWNYRNPHSFVRLIVRDARNREQQWIVECGGTQQLKRHGVTAATLRPGQHVIVTGSPGHVAAEHRLLLRSLVRPQDGLTWSDR